MDFAMGVIDLLNSKNSNYNFKIFLSTLLWTFEEVKPHILICFLEVLPTHFRTRIITFSCEQFFKVQSKCPREPKSLYKSRMAQEAIFMGKV